MTDERPLRGLALPFRITGGRVAVAEDTRKAEDDLRHLLTTRVGERMLRRDYGGGMHQYLHQADNQAIRALLRHGVELALRNHLPQLQLAGPVRVVHGEGELRVLIDYRLDPADVVRSLEVPLTTLDAGQARRGGGQSVRQPGGRNREDVPMTAARGVPVDYTTLGYEALRSAMLDIAERTLPEWTDRSENDLGVLLIELMAYASDVTMYYQTRIAQQLFPGSADDPAALVPLLRLLGYELRPPAVATADLSIAIGATTTLPLTVPAGTGFVAELPSGDQVRFETVRTYLIRDIDLGPVETGDVRRFAPLPAAEGRTVVGEVIGRSDGSPSQLCSLARSPAIAGSISVTVSEPGGATVWREVATMVDVTPVDRVFSVQRDATGAARLLFGDGVNGRIPPARPPRRPTSRPPTG